MNQRGLEYWSYLCVWPKAPWISEFIDHDAVNMRMWLWASYVYRLKGVLMWETTYWNSNEASPKGYLQNPWQEAMSWVTGYGWPYGKQTIWGNGDGRFFYPETEIPTRTRQPPIRDIRSRPSDWNSSEPVLKITNTCAFWKTDESGFEETGVTGERSQTAVADSKIHLHR